MKKILFILLCFIPVACIGQEKTLVVHGDTLWYKNITTNDSTKLNWTGSSFIILLKDSATLNFDLTALSYQDLNTTVQGAAIGDVVAIGVPNGAVVLDLTYFGWVSGTNTVTIRASRVGGGGATDPPSGNFKVAVFK